MTPPPRYSFNLHLAWSTWQKSRCIPGLSEAPCRREFRGARGCCERQFLQELRCHCSAAAQPAASSAQAHFSPPGIAPAARASWQNAPRQSGWNSCSVWGCPAARNTGTGRGDAPMMHSVFIQAVHFRAGFTSWNSPYTSKVYLDTFVQSDVRLRKHNETGPGEADLRGQRRIHSANYGVWTGDLWIRGTITGTTTTICGSTFL